MDEKQESILEYIFESDNSCTITKYNGQAEYFVVPDEIEGRLVKCIAKYAFSEHRELVEITLPKHLEKIGAHAFYNCRNISTVTLTDGVNDIEDGAFKNCSKIDFLKIEHLYGKMSCLRGILSELNQEITSEIKFENDKAVLVFPYYSHSYEENTPARIINEVTIGSGVMYRECIKSDEIEYAVYDKQFKLQNNIDVSESAAKIALNRLLFPYCLGKAAEKEYRNFINYNKDNIIKMAIDNNMIEVVKGIITIDVLDEDTCKSVSEYARSKEKVEILSLILQYRNERYGSGKKKYEF